MTFFRSPWLFAVLLLVFTACTRQPAPLTDQEKQKVSEMTKNLRPRCIGRYVINIPADALVSGGATVHGVKIESKSMSQDEYFREIGKREAELRGVRSIDAYPFLYSDDVVDGPNTRYFIHRGDVGADPGNRVIEAYKWDRGYRFKLGIDGSDFLHPDQTKDSIVQQIPVKNDVPEKRQLVFDLVKRLHGRADDTIPSKPGLCFPGAFLSGQPADGEYVWAQFVMDSYRDVSIGMVTDSSIVESRSLLERGDEINNDLRAIDGRTIRKGTVALQGLSAEEWIFTGKSNSGVQGIKCLLEANSKTGGTTSPALQLDLDAGSNNAFMQDRIAATSMSESEAVALWDVISRTLRPRPSGL
ncbi:T6SS immunity protein Tli4 family protein [Paraburkholderia sp. EG286B]|uniref:T6SS immunity protein Tli4 family protein n=1 Tax=Paraburkholderia sp. EG286B TaxID=3237011 RepID=UPI0034D26BF7